MIFVSRKGRGVVQPILTMPIQYVGMVGMVVGEMPTHERHFVVNLLVLPSSLLADVPVVHHPCQVQQRDPHVPVRKKTIDNKSNNVNNNDDDNTSELAWMPIKLIWT